MHFDGLGCAYCLILYYFVNINLTNYNTKPVKAQLKQIVDVTQRHLILFPGILLQGAAIAALVPILPKYATQVVKVSTVEYTIAIIIGGIGVLSMLFYQKSSIIIAKVLCMELFLVALYYIQFLYSGYLQLQIYI